MKAVSVLYREPKLLKGSPFHSINALPVVSVLYREPKLLKVSESTCRHCRVKSVSVLYREPKLLKGSLARYVIRPPVGFSALP